MTTQQTDWAIDIPDVAPPAPAPVGYPRLQWQNKCDWLPAPNDINKRMTYSGWSLQIGRSPEFDAVATTAGLRRDHIRFKSGSIEEHWFFEGVTLIVPITRAFDTPVGRGLELYDIAEGRPIVRSEHSNMLVGWRPKTDYMWDTKTKKKTKTFQYKASGHPELESFWEMPILLIASNGKPVDYPRPMLISFTGRVTEDRIVGIFDKWKGEILPWLVQSAKVGAEVRRAIAKEHAAYEQMCGETIKRTVNLTMVAIPLDEDEIGVYYITSAKNNEQVAFAVPRLMLPRDAKWAASLVTPAAVRSIAEDLMAEVHEWMLEETPRQIYPDGVVLPALKRRPAVAVTAVEPEYNPEDAPV